MITVIAKWDKGWMDARCEGFIFRQVIEAFDVDRLIFTPDINAPQRGIEQMSTEEALWATRHDGPRVFLEPTGEKTLNDIPEGDIVLILGNTVSDNLKYSKPEERYRFKTARPQHHGIFAITAVGIALAHRFGQ